MTGWRRRRACCGRPVAGPLLAALLCACAPADAPVGDGGMHITFEDVPAPEAFAFRGPAVRDGAEDSVGLWASVPGLPRPERGVVANVATGDEVVVALFRGRGTTSRLSGDAAEAIGLEDQPIQVTITALRKKPRIDTTSGRF